MSPGAEHLSKLSAAWWPFVPDIGRDKRLCDDFRRWVANAESKSVMRIFWDLRIERDMERLLEVWRHDGTHVAALNDLIGNVSAIPETAWLEFMIHRRGPIIQYPFTPLNKEITSGWLVHFTHDPAALYREGFLGTPDADELSSTFCMPKQGSGYNFAFDARSFDVANYADDTFYGDDALLFRAEHLETLNLESLDREAIFWGEDVLMRDAIHLTKDDDTSLWSAVTAKGDMMFAAREIGHCIENVLGENGIPDPTFFGERSYAMRSEAFGHAMGMTA